MKKLVIVIIAMTMFLPLAWSQDRAGSIPLIGSQAPSFTAKSTSGTIHFPGDYGKNWKILFSHPRDFTPVCSSELIELSDLQPVFKKLNTNIVVLSTDELKQHQDWKASLETVKYNGKATPTIDFPIVDDSKGVVSNMYGMLQSPIPANSTEDVRGVFIIDPDNVVRALFFYPTNVGRNMDEIVRTVQALQTSHDNIVTPANWEPGGDVMLKYLTDDQKKELGSSNTNIYQVAWYMTLMKSPSP